VNVIPLGGGVSGASWSGRGGRLVMLPPGQVPDGAQVVAVVAVVPDGGARSRSVRQPGLHGRSPVALVGSSAVRGPAGGPSSDGPRRTLPSAAPPAPFAPAPVMPAPAVAPTAAPATGTSAPPTVTGPEPARRIGPDLLLDLEGRLVFADGEPLELTRREFDLLAHLATRPGRVLSRSQLLAAVWGLVDTRYAGPRTVDVHVARLRRKLGERHGAPLSTLRGVGYRWSTETKVTR
jgi:hypothetical protein